MKKFSMLMLLGAAVTLAGCDAPVPTSDQKMNQKQEQLSNEAASEIGLPAIVNFQEKRMLKDIFELRDKTITTITYIEDLSGHLHKLCDSVGYGLPYATQYTNPLKVGYASSQVGVVTLPQADPNALFSPATAEGTWVKCLNPTTKKVDVVYIEPRIVVSPFELQVQ